SGMNYDTAMRIAYADSPVRQSDNPGDVAQFMGEFRQKWIQEHDTGKPDWMDGFRPQVGQAENNLLAQHVTERQHAISQAVRDNMGIETKQILTKLTELEQTPEIMPEDVARYREQAATQINNLTASMIKNGLPGKEANALVAEAVMTHAEKSLDSTYMNLLYN